MPLLLVWLNFSALFIIVSNSVVTYRSYMPLQHIAEDSFVDNSTLTAMDDDCVKVFENFQVFLIPLE
jgi:hypothetical protein